MKSKKTTYLLLGIVVVIWGLIGYRLFTPRHEGSNSQVAVETGKTPPEPEPDNLLLSYRDPFLGELAVPPRPQTQTPIQPLPAAINAPEREAVQASWTGTIKKGKNEYFLVTVNGTMFSLRPGTVTEGLSVRKIKPDEIVLTRKGESFHLKLP